jgi:hypothetical protein
MTTLMSATSTGRKVADKSTARRASAAISLH